MMHFKHFKPHEQAILRNAFKEDAYPSHKVKEALAARLNTTYARIQIWFQNERSRVKRSSEQQQTKKVQQEEEPKIIDDNNDDDEQQDDLMANAGRRSPLLTITTQITKLVIYE